MPGRSDSGSVFEAIVATPRLVQHGQWKPEHGAGSVPEIARAVSGEGRATARLFAALLVRPVVTLFDLQRELVEAEGVASFADLGLGASIYHVDAVQRMFRVAPDSRWSSGPQQPPAVTSSAFVEFVATDPVAQDLLNAGGDAASIVDAFARSKGYERGRPLGIHIANFSAFVTLIRQESARIESVLRDTRTNLVARVERHQRHVVRAVTEALGSSSGPLTSTTREPLLLQPQRGGTYSVGQPAAAAAAPTVVAPVAAVAPVATGSAQSTLAPPQPAATSGALPRRRGRIAQQAPVAVAFSAPAVNVPEQSQPPPSPSASAAVMPAGRAPSPAEDTGHFEAWNAACCAGASAPSGADCGWSRSLFWAATTGSAEPSWKLTSLSTAPLLPSDDLVCVGGAHMLHPKYMEHPGARKLLDALGVRCIPEPAVHLTSGGYDVTCAGFVSLVREHARSRNVTALRALNRLFSAAVGSGTSAFAKPTCWRSPVGDATSLADDLRALPWIVDDSQGTVRAAAEVDVVGVPIDGGILRAIAAAEMDACALAVLGVPSTLTVAAAARAAARHLRSHHRGPKASHTARPWFVPATAADSQFQSLVESARAAVKTVSTAVVEAGVRSEEDVRELRTFLEAPCVAVPMADILSLAAPMQQHSVLKSDATLKLAGFLVRWDCVAPHTAMSLPSWAPTSDGVFRAQFDAFTAADAPGGLDDLLSAAGVKRPHPAQQAALSWLTRLGMYQCCGTQAAVASPVQSAWRLHAGIDEIALGTIMRRMSCAVFDAFTGPEWDAPSEWMAAQFADAPGGVWLPGAAGWAEWSADGLSRAGGINRSRPPPIPNLFFANDSMLAQRFGKTSVADSRFAVVVLGEGGCSVPRQLRALFAAAFGLRDLSEVVWSEVAFDGLRSSDALNVQAQISAVVPYVQAFLASRFPRYYRGVEQEVTHRLDRFQVRVCDEPRAVHTLTLSAPTSGDTTGTSATDPEPVIVRAAGIRGLYVPQQATLFLSVTSLARAKIAPFATLALCPEYSPCVMSAVSQFISKVLGHEDTRAAVGELRGDGQIFRVFATEVAKGNGVVDMLPSDADRHWVVKMPLSRGSYHETFPPGTNLVATAPTPSRVQSEAAPRARDALRHAHDARAAEIVAASRKRDRAVASAALEDASPLPTVGPSRPSPTPGSELTPFAAGGVVATVSDPNAPGDDMAAAPGDSAPEPIELLPLPDNLFGGSFARGGSGVISIGSRDRTQLLGGASIFDSSAQEGPQSAAASRAAEQFVASMLRSTPSGAGERCDVQWVNEHGESGKPFDVQMRHLDAAGRCVRTTYIEVKSTITRDKRNFELSLRELLYAAQHGSNFEVYRVYSANALLDKEGAARNPRVQRIPDPIAQWRSGRLVIKASIDAMPN